MTEFSSKLFVERVSATCPPILGRLSGYDQAFLCSDMPPCKRPEGKIEDSAAIEACWSTMMS